MELEDLRATRRRIRLLGTRDTPRGVVQRRDSLVPRRLFALLVSKASLSLCLALCPSLCLDAGSPSDERDTATAAYRLARRLAQSGRVEGAVES